MRRSLLLSGFRPDSALPGLGGLGSGGNAWLGARVGAASLCVRAMTGPDRGGTSCKPRSGLKPSIGCRSCSVK